VYKTGEIARRELEAGLNSTIREANVKSKLFLVVLVALVATATNVVADAPQVDTSSEYSGTYGMRVPISDTNPAYVETDTPSGETVYTFRFYINANCLELLSGDSFSVLEALNSSDNKELAVLLSKSGDDFLITFEACVDGSSCSTSTPTVLPPGWHSIEGTWKAGSPGSLTARMDNWSVPGVDSISNSSSTIDTTRMGTVSGIDSGTSGFVKFDDFASFRTDSQIGPVSVFSDIATNNMFWPEIHALYGSGVTGGCGGGNYCDTSAVTRGQMAAFILRSENLASCFYSPPAGPGTPTFGDVPVGYIFYDLIEEFYAQGFTGGCGGGNYCPDRSVTRAEMAVFLLRGKYGAGYVPTACSGDSGFADVPDSNLYCPWIRQLALDGITGGCGGGNYCPDAPVTRGSMAAFLQRTYGLIRVLP
jgi:hypothetical protein